MSGIVRGCAMAWPALGRGSLLVLFALAATLAGAPSIRAEGAGTPRSYAAGWNLVAIPPDTNFSLATLLYTLQPDDTAYEQVAAGQATIAGFGYWASIGAADQGGYSQRAVLSAGSDTPYSIAVPAGGWVMVGDPSGLLTASIQGAEVAYSYDPTKGYQSVTRLQPGQGAWVTSLAGGVVTVTPRQPVAQPQPSSPAPTLGAAPTTPSGVAEVATPPPPIPLTPNPLTAVAPMSVYSWLTTPQPPLNPPLPYFPSAPYFGRLLCPSDVITEVALILCGTLAANGPSAAAVVTPIGGSGANSGSLVVSASLMGNCSGEEILTVQVRDASGNPVQGAAVSVHIQFATTTQDLTLALTNVTGQTSQVIDIGSPSAGVPVMWTVTASSGVGTGVTSATCTPL